MLKKPICKKKSFDKKKTKIPIIKLKTFNDNKSDFSECSLLSRRFSYFGNASSGSSGKQEKEAYKKLLYSHLLDTINNLIKEICENIAILYYNIHGAQKSFEFRAILKNCIKYKKKVLYPLYFQFKWNPVNNREVVNQISLIIKNPNEEISLTSLTVNSNPQQRQELMEFYCFLLDYLHYPMQLITKKQLKFFRSKLLIKDDPFLLANLEYFLAFNDLDEFVENFYEYEKLMFSYNKSTRSIFEKKETSIDEIDDKFPGILHFIRVSKQRNLFINLIRARDVNLLRILVDSLPFQKKNMSKLVKDVVAYLKEHQPEKGRANKSWTRQLWESIKILPQNKVTHLKNLDGFLKDLLENKIEDSSILQSILNVWLFTNDKGELIENISIYLKHKNLNLYQQEVVELRSIFTKFNLSNKTAENFINAIFVENQEISEVCSDFYQVYLQCKNEENLIKQIKLFKHLI